MVRRITGTFRVATGGKGFAMIAILFITTRTPVATANALNEFEAYAVALYREGMIGI